MEISYFDGFDKLKTNFIFGVKFFFINNTTYIITWEKKYAPLAVLFLDDEFSGLWGRPTSLKIKNKTFVDLTEEAVITIMHEQEATVLGSVEYIERASMLVRSIDNTNESDNLNDEIERLLQQGKTP